MTFIYPAVFTPHENGEGYHAVFPDLECCEADGRDLEDAVENAREAALDWITIEITEYEGDLPFSTCIEDVEKKEGELVKNIMVRVKLLPDND